MKELNAELLSLIFKKEVINFKKLDPNNLLIELGANEELKYMKLNIDTMARLMKELAGRLGFTIESASYFMGEHKPYSKIVEEEILFTHRTEFEAVSKAFQWVAKTKGLLK